MESQFGDSYLPNGVHGGSEYCNENFPTYSGIQRLIDLPLYSKKKNDIDTYKTDINTYLLSRIASLSNIYLLPTVKFTWGCYKFQQKVGYLTIDI